MMIFRAFPAQAGIFITRYWTPAFAGVTRCVAGGIVAISFLMTSTYPAFACSPVILTPPPSLKSYEQALNAPPIPDSLKGLAREFGVDQEYVRELNSAYCDFAATHDEQDDYHKINGQIIHLIIQKWANYK